MNHEIRSNKYRRIAKWVLCLSILILVGLFFSFGIPYPFPNKNVIHCPVGNEGEEFQLVSTYRKYIHLGMFFKDVSTRSRSSRYKIYFKSPNQFFRRRLESTLQYTWHKTADKKYCPYFGTKKGVLYFSIPGWGELSISEDGGRRFEKRYPESIVELRRNIYKQAASKHLFDKRQISIDPPHITHEVGIFPDKEPCTRDNYLYNSDFDKRLCTPITVYRIESNDLGLSWTEPMKVEKSELFK